MAPHSTVLVKCNLYEGENGAKERNEAEHEQTWGCCACICCGAVTAGIIIVFNLIQSHNINTFTMRNKICLLTWRAIFEVEQREGQKQQDKPTIGCNQRSYTSLRS